MKRTPGEKKELRIRICLDIVILLAAALLTYQFVIKDYRNNRVLPVQNAETVEASGEAGL